MSEPYLYGTVGMADKSMALSDTLSVYAPSAANALVPMLMAVINAVVNIIDFFMLFTSKLTILKTGSLFDKSKACKYLNYCQSAIFEFILRLNKSRGCFAREDALRIAKSACPPSCSLLSGHARVTEKPKLSGNDR